MMFYIIENSVGKVCFETEYFFPMSHNQGNAPVCKACGEIIGMLEPLPPFEVELELWDKGFGDVAYGSGDYLLVSERFKILWQEHGLTGLQDFSPVDIVKIKRHKEFKGDPPKYYLVGVVFSNALIDQDASGFEWEEKPKCKVCYSGRILKRWKSIVLKPDTWSGENIFKPRGMGGTFMVDERLKDFCEQFNITNTYFIPAEEYGHDFYPWENE